MITSRQYCTVAAPQGRSILKWKSKRLPRRVKVPVVALSEVYPVPGQPSSKELSPSLFFYGDNKPILAYLLTHGYRGKVKLIYIDPPFDTGLGFARRVFLRGPGRDRVVSAREPSLARQLQYLDSWDSDSYLQFMYERLLLLRDMLDEEGSIWLHCDYRRTHYLRMLLDEVFGPWNYLNTISWRSQTARGAKVDAFYFPYSTQYIEVYARNRRAPTTWNSVHRRVVMSEAEAAAQFMRDTHGFFRTSDPGTYSFESLVELNDQGRLYAPYRGRVIIDEENRRVYASNGGNIGVKYYLTDLSRGRYAMERGVDNLWDDIPGLGTTPAEDLGYPTQKTEALLRRVIAVSTNPGDLVLDCFSGSGTTCAVAQKMGRQWIGCDSNLGAVQTSLRRLYWVMHLQARDSKSPQRHAHTRSWKNEPGENLPVDDIHAINVYASQTDRANRAGSDPPAIQAQFERCVETTDVVRVQILGYASPSIAALLQHAIAPTTSITDWRRLVDSIMIDADYDGKVFRVVLFDAPRQKDVLVQGEYWIKTELSSQVVAVKITDILGEECLITQKV